MADEIIDGDTGQLVPVEEPGTARMLATPEEALGEYRRLKEFVGKVMIPGVDYGKIPGTGGKDVLLKPGAEKLCEVYGYSADVEIIKAVEEWTAKPPFFHYTVKVTLRNKRTGKVVAAGVGSCNSLEVKYKYRTEYWNERGDPPVADGWEKKSRKGGGTFWMRRVLNEETADLTNTILKMAKKRAHVDATLAATRSSDLFTQDMEDFREEEPAEERASRARQPSNVPIKTEVDDGDSDFVKPPVIPTGVVIIKHCADCGDMMGPVIHAGNKDYGIDDWLKKCQAKFRADLCARCSNDRADVLKGEKEQAAA
jgi:hypothetical protein